MRHPALDAALVVRVTAEDVKNGRSDPEDCPVAHAAVRALAEAGVDVAGLRVAVSPTLIVTRDYAGLGRNSQWRMSARGRRLVRMFDAGYAVGPITLRLELSPHRQDATAPTGLCACGEWFCSRVAWPA